MTCLSVVEQSRGWKDPGYREIAKSRRDGEADGG